MKAYDIEILTRRADRGSADHHGWCYGLPPGIGPEQWPLDPANGYPLQHGFTLRLPEDYRCHGPGIVAVSFFASPFDLNDGGPIVRAPAIRAALTAPQAPDDPDLLPFWRAERTAHPRLYRFEDGIGIAFAALLLTQQEFDGPLCPPPRLDPNPYRDALEPPDWLTLGSAAAYWAFAGYMRCVQDTFGEEPAAELDENRALRLTPRAHDPNAGRTPFDQFLHAPTDYVHPDFPMVGEAGEETYREDDWRRDHHSNHVGGTMRPSQWVPRFSPYYVEFDEELGGFNFGGGNAQLDVRDMKFEWACG